MILFAKPPSNAKSGDENSGSSSKEKHLKGNQKRKPPAARKRLTTKQRAIRLLLRTFVTVTILVLFLTVVGGVFICHTSDMFPALRDGDLVVTFRLGEYHSGDIVAYDCEGKTCFGRIVGEPTDEIFIDAEGTYTINGTRPYETVFYTTATRESDIMHYPYRIEPGEYFVLVDAREDGFDSRNIGPVTKLKGKVVLMLRRRGF